MMFSMTTMQPSKHGKLTGIIVHLDDDAVGAGSGLAIIIILAGAALGALLGLLWSLV